MKLVALVCFLPLVLGGPQYKAQELLSEDNLLNQENFLGSEEDMYDDYGLYRNEDGLGDKVAADGGSEEFHDSSQAGTDLQRLAARELHTSKVTFPQSCQQLQTQAGGPLPSGEYTVYNPENYVELDQGFQLEPTEINCQFPEGESKQKRQMAARSLSNVTHPRDCSDIFMYYLSGDRSTRSGIYKVFNPKWYNIGPDGVNLLPIYVYCDMLTSGGGWTIFQRRQDGKVDFYQDWHNYEHGFGAIKGEYWLGLRFINMITSLRKQVLSVEMTSNAGVVSYATYNGFSVGDDSTAYKLSLACYTGNDTYGDRLSYHKNNGFSTKDRGSAVNCAKNTYHGGWWYRNCGANCNLNGIYGQTGTTGLFWGGASLTVNKKFVTMSFRPEYYR